MPGESTRHTEPPKAANSVLQARSRETLDRILTAAEELLETREFDELTMADLADHAGCGVGTVYGRLENKESLLLCLHERYMDAGRQASTAVFQKCADAELDVRVRALCSLLIEFFAGNRGVTRAITNYLFTRPSDDVSANLAIFRRDATAAFRQAASFLSEKVDRRIHPHPQAACEFGLLAAQDVAQSRLVFGDRSGLQIKFSKKKLKSNISSLLLNYLTHG
jgi:AcrR family transcriptional regulator